MQVKQMYTHLLFTCPRLAGGNPASFSSAKTVFAGLGVHFAPGGKVSLSPGTKL